MILDSNIAESACGLSSALLTDYKAHALHCEIVEDYQALENAARIAGFDLQIASAYRSFDRQSLIWNKKYSGERAILDANNQEIPTHHLNDLQKIQAIMLYSAMPGASRHHFGTELDVFASNLLPEKQSLKLEPWEYEEHGPFFELNIWLEKHLSDYGFFRPYKEFKGGVAAEPWHISHIEQSNKLTVYQNAENIIKVLECSNVLGKECLIQNMPLLVSQYVSNV